ncbi:protein adenylyltransferase SelO [Arcobacter sp.]|uniref:protein adenylyltransferase SelO n=1 Tax=unclassified Arcobacter TaxID=2593671 RepID=UPI003B006CDA|eukprot:TRINITY_DN19621_c0_g1_i2.p1 TRINITY_DN19621_c0_g1~~TRINITY_DN19621_c0_g1_i2.p1  ORF type:complete len:486 (-),score=-57.75 TRINITY_DN19621_c0_g1_i2:606-2063(-)
MKLNEIKLENDYFEFDEKFYQRINPTPLNNPFLISYNKLMFDEISLDYDEANSKDFVKFVNGEKLLEGSEPYASAYAGHQFGYFVPQLGDGRAINLGKINSWHLQTKGSGLTRYSRQGDGRAVLKSSIREYIISEAMHALNIPTTRVLALIGSTHPVHRYYGVVETGAIVLRMSPSWIRIGTFEYFTRSKNAKENVKQLADYVIRNSYAHLINDENKYEKMYYEMVDKTAILMAKWQTYGFMHGVMNTDNFSMAGLSIDYGPFAFMDYFNINQICNHTDSEGRYSYLNQPYVGKWNLEVLANSLKTICEVDKLNEYLKTYFHIQEKEYLTLMTQRLGLNIDKSSDSYATLIISLLKALQTSKTDYNQFFYELTKCKNYDEITKVIDISIYRQTLDKWLEKYIKLRELENQDFEKVQERIKKVNPKYVIKNYMLQEAIDKAEEGDFTLVNDLLNIAQNPYDEHNEYERYSKATPLEFSNIKLSCSS